MWLFTNFGFFSVVQKAGTANLTVRSRVKSDLDNLRMIYLPELGPTQGKAGTDYPWRATVPHAALAAAMGQIVMDVDYSNYKNEVAAKQGKPRAHRYARVWDALYDMPEDVPYRKLQAIPRKRTGGCNTGQLVRSALPGELPNIYDPQATFAADLIFEFEAAVMRLFKVDDASDVRWDGEKEPNPLDLAEYIRLMNGLIALGFEFDQYDINSLCDLQAVNARPEETIGRMALPDLRMYLHTLQRTDKWGSGCSSAFVNALASGALQLAARRLSMDFRPELEDPLPWGECDSSVAYGGLIFDDEGRVLLREPRNHYDGYVWTFPKGKPDGAEAPKATALREVQEETGLQARIVAPIPGEFAGGTTFNRYFLMVPEGSITALPPNCPETAALRWAEPGEAQTLLAQTKNEIGKLRDLAVLKAGIAVWAKRN